MQKIKSSIRRSSSLEHILSEPRKVEIRILIMRTAEEEQIAEQSSKANQGQERELEGETQMSEREYRKELRVVK